MKKRDWWFGFGLAVVVLAVGFAYYWFMTPFRHCVDKIVSEGATEEGAQAACLKKVTSGDL